MFTKTPLLQVNEWFLTAAQDNLPSSFAFLLDAFPLSLCPKTGCRGTGWEAKAGVFAAGFDLDLLAGSSSYRLQQLAGFTYFPRRKVTQIKSSPKNKGVYCRTCVYQPGFLDTRGLGVWLQQCLGEASQGSLLREAWAQLPQGRADPNIPTTSACTGPTLRESKGVPRSVTVNTVPASRQKKPKVQNVFPVLTPCIPLSLALTLKVITLF